MSAIEAIIYSACMAFVAVEIFQIRRWHAFLNRKPFTCITCLSGWLALIVYGIHLLTIPVMATAMVFSILLTAILKRI